MTVGRNGTRSTTRTLLTVMSTSLALAIGVAGCGTTEQAPLRSAKAKIDPKYGVAPSPRVVGMGEPVPKGGGRAMVGKPYKIAGKTYVPKIDPDYKVVGLASWYGPAFHGRRTANGEVFDSASISAAHPTMPLPSYARLTSLATGRSVIVRVNDRGPVPFQSRPRHVAARRRHAWRQGRWRRQDSRRICRPRVDRGG